MHHSGRTTGPVVVALPRFTNRNHLDGIVEARLGTPTSEESDNYQIGDDQKKLLIAQ